VCWPFKRRASGHKRRKKRALDQYITLWLQASRWVAAFNVTGEKRDCRKSGTMAVCNRWLRRRPWQNLSPCIAAVALCHLLVRGKWIPTEKKGRRKRIFQFQSGVKENKRIPPNIIFALYWTMGVFRLDAPFWPTLFASSEKRLITYLVTENKPPLNKTV
jgi:hypothetical protein